MAAGDAKTPTCNCRDTWIVSRICASATTVEVDLNTTLPRGYGLWTVLFAGTVLTIHYSYAASPGTTIDFGRVELFWGGPLESPDTPPQFAYGYPDLAYIQSGVTVTYKDTVPYATWNIALCLPNGSDCGLQPIFVDLLFTMPDGDNSIHFGWFSNYDYFPPAVPEPSTWVMPLIGFAGLGLMAARQRKPKFC